MQVETIRITAAVSDENPNGYIVINKADFDEAQHELWTDPDAPDEPEALHVGKGPGGRFYLKRGKERVSGPYDDQEAADAALSDAVKA